MILNEITTQLNEYFDEIGINLDISETEYNAAVKSYHAVANWLADEKSLLAPYNPEILPQGSFLLGTMIKPIHKKDDLDVDLVCRLDGKNINWAQYHLKKVVGDRLKENKTYNELLVNEKRRCWTLKYSESYNYHLDILPSVISHDQKIIFEKAFSSIDFKDFEKTAIRITDKEASNYYNETNPDYWHKSNPFGYAAWFQERCSISIRKSVFLSDSVKPVPNYQKDKLPLQRVVQILKRHRDIMFNGDQDKPISIIITTLASKAYQKETDIYSALINVINRMELFIEEKYSGKYNKLIKLISNPVNIEENFADKWPENPIKEENFYKWLKKIKSDINAFYEKRGIENLEKAFSESFGEDLVKVSFDRIADRSYNKRESGQLFMENSSGVLTTNQSNGTIVKKHNFHG